MKYLIIPLLWSAILADVYCMWKYDSVSDALYYIGEPIVYMTWVLAFWIAMKWKPTELQRKFIVGTLLMWLPFCANTIYRQVSGLGHEKSIIDLYTFYVSVTILFIQLFLWVSKSINKKGKEEIY